MINKFLADINNSDDIKPHYDEAINTGHSYTKINVYDPKCISPLHKYWFFLETSKIISVKKTKNTTVRLALSMDHNIKLIKFMSNLENAIFLHCQEDFKGDIILKKTIHKQKKFPPTLNIKIADDINIFNDAGNKINVNNIRENDNISIYFELKNIWIDMRSCDFWFNLCAIQIQKKQLINLTQSLFINEHNEQLTAHATNVAHINTAQNTTLHARNNKPNISSHANNKSNNETSNFSLNLNDILNQRSKLKSAKKNTDIDKTETPLNKFVSADALVAQLSKLKNSKEIVDNNKEMANDDKKIENDNKETSDNHNKLNEKKKKKKKKINEIKGNNKLSPNKNIVKKIKKKSALDN